METPLVSTLGVRLAMSLSWSIICTSGFFIPTHQLAGSTFIWAHAAWLTNAVKATAVRRFALRLPARAFKPLAIRLIDMLMLIV